MRVWIKSDCQNKKGWFTKFQQRIIVNRKTEWLRISKWFFCEIHWKDSYGTNPEPQTIHPYLSIHTIYLFMLQSKRQIININIYVSLSDFALSKLILFSGWNSFDLSSNRLDTFLCKEREKMKKEQRSWVVMAFGLKSREERQMVR